MLSRKPSGNVKVGIIGASGYVGGELLRLLIQHPGVDIRIATSRDRIGDFVYRTHPNLRSFTQLKFSKLDLSTIGDTCEILFASLPHGKSVELVPQLLDKGLTVIDMSADFRLKAPEDYRQWYGFDHPAPELLTEAVYGLPELHRQEIRKARLVAVPGCMSSVSVLALAPLVRAGLIDMDRIVVDAKIGSSGAGAKPSVASHHPERFGGVRPYKIVGHRHIAEIEQELGQISGRKVKISFSPHAVNMVRGILATIHAFTDRALTPRELWQVYRSSYESEPFIRLVRDRKGLYKLPDPKIVIGSNFCDIGFEVDPHTNRIIVVSAIDNMLKGAAGQAVQCLNIMLSLDERSGLNQLPPHPL